MRTNTVKQFVLAHLMVITEELIRIVELGADMVGECGMRVEDTRPLLSKHL